MVSCFPLVPKYRLFTQQLEWSLQNLRMMLLPLCLTHPLASHLRVKFRELTITYESLNTFASPCFFHVISYHSSPLAPHSIPATLSLTSLRRKQHAPTSRPLYLVVPSAWNILPSDTCTAPSSPLQLYSRVCLSDHFPYQLLKISTNIHTLSTPVLYFTLFSF